MTTKHTKKTKPDPRLLRSILSQPLGRMRYLSKQRKPLQTEDLDEFCGTLWRTFLFFREFGCDKPVSYLKSIASVSQTPWDKPGTSWDTGQEKWSVVGGQWSEKNEKGRFLKLAERA